MIPCLPRLGIHDSQGGILGCKGKTHDICYLISLLQKSQLASASTDMTWVRNKVWTGWCLALHPCPHTKRSVIHWTVLASCAHDLSREHTRLLISKKVNDKPGAMCNMENHVVLCRASDMSPLYIYTHFNLILAIMRSYIYSIQVKSFSSYQTTEWRKNIVGCWCQKSRFEYFRNSWKTSLDLSPIFTCPDSVAMIASDSFSRLTGSIPNVAVSLDVLGLFLVVFPHHAV